jgi:hypothetical protein
MAHNHSETMQQHPGLSVKIERPLLSDVEAFAAGNNVAIARRIID